MPALVTIPLQPVERRGRPLDGRPDLVFPTDVRPERDHACAAAFERARERGEPIAVAIEQRDGGALVGEPLAGGLADAARRARDQHRSSAKAPHAWCTFTRPSLRGQPRECVSDRCGP